MNIQEIEDDVEKIGEFIVLYVAEKPGEMIKNYSWVDDMDEEMEDVKYEYNNYE